MGEQADYVIDALMFDEYGEYDPGPQPDWETRTWVTANGEVIPVKDMTTIHVQNALRRFAGGDLYVRDSHLWYAIFRKELESREREIIDMFSTTKEEK